MLAVAEAIQIPYLPQRIIEFQYDLYFTLKYVAGYGARIPRAQQTYPFSYWSARKAEVEAQHAIDALLRHPLPEEQLWRERQQLEAKLFGGAEPYDFFL